MSGPPGRMEEKVYDVQAVKDRLNAYRDGEREIENQTEALERLRNKLEGVGAQEITGMPRSPSPPTDRMSDLVAQKIEIEEEIAGVLESQRKERKFITSVLRKIKSADERAVIRFRYLIGLSWDEVTDALFGACIDYLGKEETYQRRVYRIHGSALLHMAEYIESHGLMKTE